MTESSDDDEDNTMVLVHVHNEKAKAGKTQAAIFSAIYRPSGLLSRAHCMPSRGA